jgi:Tfp pilus assembly protein PilO
VLEEKERRVILYLVIILVVNFLVYIMVVNSLKNSYYSKLENYSSLRKNLLILKSEINEKKFELLKWQRAEKDIKNLRENYFYSRSNGIEIVRKYLEKLAKEKGIYINEINYSYKVDEKNSIGEIGISFSVTDNYFRLKDFLSSIESEPKFIIIRKIDLIGTEILGNVNTKIYLSAFTNEK